MHSTKISLALPNHFSRLYLWWGKGSGDTVSIDWCHFCDMLIRKINIIHYFPSPLRQTEKYLAMQDHTEIPLSHLQPRIHLEM